MRLSDLVDLPKKVVTNALGSYLGFFAQAATALLLTPFLVHRLGDVEFGLWVLLTTILGYFQLLELGIIPAVLRFVAHHKARNEAREVDAIIGSAFHFLILLSIASVPIVALVARFAPDALGLHEAQRAVFTRGVWLVGLAGVIAAFRRLFVAVIEAHQRYVLLNLSEALAAVFAAVLSVVAVGRGHGIVMLVVVAIVQMLGEIAFAMFLFRRVLHVRVSPRLRQSDSLKALLGYSKYSFLIDLSLSVSHKLHAILIGIFLPESAITSYSLGNRLAGMIESVTEPLITTFFPLASELHTEDTPASLRRLLIHGTRISLMIATPGLVLAGWHGGLLLTWWIGADYVEASLPILQIFLVVVLGSVIEGTAARILLGIGQVRFDAAVSVGSALTNLGLSVTLVQSHGIVGVALGTLIPSFAGKILISVPYTCRLTDTRLGVFAAQALGPAAVIAVAMLGFMALTGGRLGSELAEFLVHLAFAAVVALIVLVQSRPRSAPPSMA